MTAMTGGELIQEARKRADLSQRELAELLSTTQAQITRWETGQRSPTFKKVVEAVRACGFDLSVRIVTRDDDHALLVQENLRLTPQDRIDRLALARSKLDELLADVTRKDSDDGI